MIGFYDSGLGGLTIIEKFLSLRPETKCLYLADVKNCPLGNKSDEEILEATTKGVEFLFDKGCVLVVLACNTATSLAVRPLQQIWLLDKPEYAGRNILGVVKPVTEALINNKNSVEPILLLATEATCRSQFYQRELQSEGFTNYDCLSFTNLALAIERQDDLWINKILDQEIVDPKIARYRTFVLACTHYPIVRHKIERAIRQRVDHEIRIVDQSALVAERLVHYLNSHLEYFLALGGLDIFITGGEQNQYKANINKLFPSLEFRLEAIF